MTQRVAGLTFAEIARSQEFRVRYSERGLRRLAAGIVQDGAGAQTALQECVPDEGAQER